VFESHTRKKSEREKKTKEKEAGCHICAGTSVQKKALRTKEAALLIITGGFVTPVRKTDNERKKKRKTRDETYHSEEEHGNDGRIESTRKNSLKISKIEPQTDFGEC